MSGRTFDPAGAVLDALGRREEALGLLQAVVDSHGGSLEALTARLGDRTAGFLRGMRDRLLTQEDFAPSEAQTDWLRKLVGVSGRVGAKRYREGGEKAGAGVPICRACGGDGACRACGGTGDGPGCRYGSGAAYCGSCNGSGRCHCGG